jgi:diguanylate cyclase (GGDEF)-like protein
VLLPGADLQQAASMAERLREGVAAYPVGGGLRVTMSFGVSASARDSVFDYETISGEADAALYEAKHDGRDGVRTWAGVPVG